MGQVLLTLRPNQNYPNNASPFQNNTPRCGCTDKISTVNTSGMNSSMHLVCDGHLYILRTKFFPYSVNELHFDRRFKWDNCLKLFCLINLLNLRFERLFVHINPKIIKILLLCSSFLHDYYYLA